MDEDHLRDVGGPMFLTSWNSKKKSWGGHVLTLTNK
jgi:hypothetical protein